MSVSISSQFTQRNYNWTDWKVVKLAKSLVCQYDDNGTIYTIYGYDGPEVHICTIFKNEVPYSIIEQGYSQSQNDSDKSDFETNFKDKGNESLSESLTHKNIYAASNVFSIASSATDVFSITGSSSKTVKILKVCISSSSSFSTTKDLLCIKRSTNNTGGTSAGLQIAPYDSYSPAATATVRSYTANPATLGTSVGNIRSIKLMFSPTNSETKPLAHIDIDFLNKGIILNNENESLCLNLSGATVSGGSIAICIEWVEE